MKSDRVRLVIVLAMIAACFAGSKALAETLMVSEGDKIEIDLSLQYPTRVFFEYDAGAALIFNNADAAEGDLSAPRVAATVDEKGDVYLTVMSGLIGQKISGFLTTESGRTYIIDLTIKNKDADQIKIVSREARDKALAAKVTADQAAATPNLKPVKWRRDASHHDSLSNLMRALYFGQMPEGFKRTQRFYLKQQAKDGVSRKVAVRYEAENVEAITYDMTNNNAYFVNPEQFQIWFRPYIALAFETDELEAGRSGKVYVLRRKAGK